MVAEFTLPLVLIIIFTATLVRSAFGFGEALIAVPLLALIIPVREAAPVAVLVSITVAGIIIFRDWHQIHLGSAKRLVLSTLIGTPFGLLVLTLFSDRIVQILLAIVIIAFSLYRLIGRNRLVLKDDRLAWLFGFSAGVLGGAYGMNGPPLVAYGALRQWSPVRFRATLQGYFLPASMMAMGGYWIAGLWTAPVTHYYLISLPVVLTAVLLGHVLNRKLGRHSFLVYVYIGLLFIGLLLIIRALF